LDKELELEKQHEKGAIGLNSNPSHYEHKTDHPRDLLGKCHNDMFTKDYD
jgi:hypothetical protein